MKKTLFTIAFSISTLGYSVAQAATGEIETTSVGQAPPARALRLTVSPGATVYRETDGFQTTVSIMQQYGSVFVGVEGGYLRWSPTTRSDYTGMPVGQTTIPLLATALYRFENDSGVYPYLGGSLGIGLTRRDNSGGNSFEVAAFARPGVEFEIAQMVSFTIEPRVGFLDNSFLFAPMVGLALSL